MKRLAGVLKSSRLYVSLSILLAFLMVFCLIPHEVLAQNLHVVSYMPLISIDEPVKDPPPEDSPPPTPTPTPEETSAASTPEESPAPTPETASGPPMVSTTAPAVDVTSSSATL